MTVSRQVAAGFCALVVVTVVTGLVSSGALHRSVTSKDLVARDFVERVSRVEGLRYRAEQVVSTSRGYLFTGDGAYLTRFDEARGVFFASAHELDALLQGDHADLMRAVYVAGQHYVDVAETAARDRRALGDTREVIAYFEKTVRPARETFDSALDRLVQAEQGTFAAALERSEDDTTRAAGLIALTTLAGVGLSLALSVAVWGGLQGHLRREQAAIAAAKRAVVAREEALAVVSHDLRNPLGAIVTGTTLLKDAASQWDAAVVRQLDAIESSAKRMRFLIEDLLDAERCDAGRVPLKLESVDVASVFDSLGKLFETRAVERGVTLEPHAAPGLRVWADRERLLQVLSNLADNALKAVPRGARVSVSAHPIDEHVRISVTDNGARHTFRRGRPSV